MRNGGHSMTEAHVIRAADGGGDHPKSEARTDGAALTKDKDKAHAGQKSTDAHGPTAGNGGGLQLVETHASPATPVNGNDSGGHPPFDTQLADAPNGEVGDQTHVETHPRVVSDFAAQLDALIEFDHKYGFWVRQTTTVVNRLKGMGRRLYAAGHPGAELKDIKSGGAGYATEVIKAATAKKPKPLSEMATMLLSAEIDTIEAYEFAMARRTFYEQRIIAIAALSPVASWWTAIKGCKLLGLGRILAQLGPGAGGKPSLDNYPTVSTVWKRLGFACNPDGTRQRRAKGAAGIEQGFNPQRCAVVFGFVDSMFMHQGKTENGTATEYRKLYEARRAKKEAETDWTKGHLNSDARRVMTKELLKHLWIEWRRATCPLEPGAPVPAAGDAHEKC